jgi:putative heme iron utilization protein
MLRDHQRPGEPSSNAGDQADLTAPSTRPPPRSPSHAERCRTLAAEARAATLATIAREPEGFPYGSLVTVAVDAAGRPLLLLSQLAEHTQNLEHRADASILLTEPLDRHRQPLALGRVTLLGPCRRLDAEDVEEARSTFLAVHPDAAGYVDFKDFAFYRLDPISLRYVGGFGRMSWVRAAEYAAAEPDPLRSAAPGILSHMNQDHVDALLAYARGLARIPDASAATMTAVDRYGFDLAVTTPGGPRVTRLAFEHEVSTSDEVRKAVIAMVKAARELLA